jgi:hypothetical protein
MKKLLALALLAALGGIGAWFFAAPAPKAPEVTFSTFQSYAERSCWSSSGQLIA